MPKLMILLIMFMYSSLSLAEIKLYACVQDGVSTLQDKPIKDCEDLQTFTYQSVYKAPKDLNYRESERAIFKEEQAMRDLQKQRYTEVDERVGGALNQREIDSRYDKCYFFKGRIDNAVVRFEQRASSYEVRELIAQMNNDTHQYQYYCGKPYPKVDSLLKKYKQEFSR